MSSEYAKNWNILLVEAMPEIRTVLGSVAAEESGVGLKGNSVEKMGLKKLKLTPATTFSKSESAISQFKNVLKLRSHALDHTV